MKVTKILYVYSETHEDAEPTSRLLGADLGLYEEWREVKMVDGGSLIAVYYLFSPEEVAKAVDRMPDNPAEVYPWDWDHVHKISLILNDGAEVDLF